MKRYPLKRYYLSQLLIAFLLPIIILNVANLFIETDSTARARLVLMSVVIGLINLGLNALINALNYTYKNSKNEWLAFYAPVSFWGLVFLLSLINATQARTVSIESYLMLLLWIEAIVYNLKIRQVLVAWFVDSANKNEEEV